MKKVLFSAWGGNGGVDDVVKSLQDGLEKQNIESEVIYHPRDYANPNDPGATDVVSSGKREYFGTFGDFLRSRNWKDYAVADFHACNLRDFELAELNRSAPHVPVLGHVHGIISYVAFVEEMEKTTQDAVNYREWLDTLTPDERAQNIRENFNPWPVCKDQETLMRTAQKLVFLTKFTRDKFRYFYPDCSQGDHREVIVPNGSDISKYANNYEICRKAAEIRDRLGQNSNVILFSGRITPPKGASDLAKAFDRIRGIYPNTKLLLVGEGHSDFGGLDCVYNYIRPDFRNDVVTTGWISDKKDLAAHYKAANVLAIPSYHETFSISALEGMMMGTPVIMGDVDGSHEVYVEPQLAYGTKPGDVDRMCQLFNYLFEDPARARGNADHVQKVVKDRYSHDRIIDTTLGLYNAAITERAFANR